MKTPFLILAAFCASAFSSQVEAICAGADPSNGCPQPFNNSNTAGPADATTITQGFDAQNGGQWSKTTSSFGNFHFSSGFSTGNSWNDPQTRFRNGFGNTAGMNSQGQTNSYNCAFYGNCR
jgi:hypothetical protein